MQRASRLFFIITHEFSPPKSSNFATLLQIHTKASPHLENPVLYHYLVDNFNFPKPKALTVSNRLSRIKTTERPESVVNYFKTLGFSDTQIIRSFNGCPQLIYTNVERTLKPKIHLFQELGLSGLALGEFISKASTILTRSVTKTLKPCICVLRKILRDDLNVNDNIIRVSVSSIRLLCSEERLSANVSYLESCGIVGSQLASLLIRQPRLFASPESDLKKLVSRAVNFGFSVDSRMFAIGLYSMSCISDETLVKKLESLKSFGFTEIECVEACKRYPTLLRMSEDKLRFGLAFYMETVGLEKAALVSMPCVLGYSIEDRMVARYRAIEVMKSKGILRREPSYISLFKLPEREFLEKYVLRFPDHVEDLLVAYKGHLLDSAE